MTQLGEARICILFDKRPSDTLIATLREHGSHRLIRKGVRAWQFKPDTWFHLYMDLLNTKEDDLADRLGRVMDQLARDDDDADDADEGAVGGAIGRIVNIACVGAGC